MAKKKGLVRKTRGKGNPQRRVNEATKKTFFGPVSGVVNKGPSTASLKDRLARHNAAITKKTRQGKTITTSDQHIRRSLKREITQRAEVSRVKRSPSAAGAKAATKRRVASRKKAGRRTR